FHLSCYPGGVSLAVPDRRLRLVERALQDEAGTPLGRVQVHVPAGHREAAGLADDLAADDGDREVQRARKPLDDDELLGVFAAEVRAAGTGDVEQLGDHGRDAVEVTRSRAAAELRSDLSDGDGEWVGFGVHLRR